ncbi:hypothetical protein PoB_005456000 [Plakobranchus ocellatus]|uniref:Uncharacterized protein n=1 Tax=Plakobranchus ocellatus TaxID=259542 RepID=A0AAV4C8R0_9GAST|nr:hypothetical protein PoB_005456000 [Plakobranchus ocellatus]
MRRYNEIGRKHFISPKQENGAIQRIAVAQKATRIGNRAASSEKIKGIACRRFENEKEISTGNSDLEATTDDGPVSTASLSAAEVQSSGWNERGYEILPELGSLGSKETVGDLRFDDELTGCLRGSDVNCKSWQAITPPFVLARMEEH